MRVEFLSSLFALLSFVMAVVVIALFSRYLEGRARVRAIIVFLAWLLYADILGYKGVVASHFPPGPAFLLVPVAVFLAGFVARNPGVKEFASKVPAALLIGLQVYRVLVEIVLHGLYQNGLIPRMLTFEGANFDILIGLSAPAIAWLYASHRISDTAVRVWSWVGIAMLLNVVIRFVLTFSRPAPNGNPQCGHGHFPLYLSARFSRPSCPLPPRTAFAFPAPDGYITIIISIKRVARLLQKTGHSIDKPNELRCQRA